MDKKTLREILAAHGLRDALAYLNQNVPYRFTSLYLFHEDSDRRSFFFDQENPESDDAGSLPGLSQYCVFVREKSKKIHFDAKNEQLDDSIQSFVGVPITDLVGNVFGSLCHFDLVPHSSSDEIVGHLEAAARILLPYIDVRGASADGVVG